MKECNIWETGYKEFFEFSNDIEKLIALIKNGDTFDIIDKYIPGNKINNPIDSKASENNVIINYTDDVHPLAISKNNFVSNSIISTSFFEKHKDRIISEMKNRLVNVNKGIVYIANYMFSDEIFNYIINSQKENTYYFKDIKLSDDQIKKLKDNFINVFSCINNKYEMISCEQVVGHYNMNKLKEMKEINIDYKISERDFENLKYISNDTKINITGFSTNNPLYNNMEANDIENNYYQNCKKIVNRLNDLGKTNMVRVSVGRRNKFNEIVLADKISNTIDLIISNDYNDYSYKAYIEEEEKLNKFVNNIKHSNLSPFEKYLKVYDIVKNFKPYKENEADKNESRYLRYILDNEYMVCVGYSNLLINLLDKVGISALEYSVGVDSSYNAGYTKEDKSVNREGHARVLLNMDDDKYNIHGIYIADPTWDNDVKRDNYNYALVTHDSMQESKELFWLNETDLFLDVHNFDEFCIKINALGKKICNKEKIVKYDVQVMNTVFGKICNNIMNLLLNIDRKSYDKLSNIYMEALKNKDEKTYNEFLTKAGHLIVSRVNKKVPDETLMNAVMEAKKYDDIYTIEELENLRKEIITKKQKKDEVVFPYERSETEIWVSKTK